MALLQEEQILKETNTALINISQFPNFKLILPSKVWKVQNVENVKQQLKKSKNKDKRNKLNVHNSTIVNQLNI